MSEHSCPFCNLEKNRIQLENDCAAAFFDAFPVTEGHTLVVPKRHVASFFELSDEERSDVQKLVERVRHMLMADVKPDGFNVGINDGPAAGQTVMHAHIHVIPRRKADVAEPRGGVRWIIPGKAAYWHTGKKDIWNVPTPEEQVQFLRNIQRLLAEGLFVASYKFALVRALADLAVLKGNDTGGPLDIETKDIAAKFVELYWRQCRPFQVGGQATGLILQQNTGKQAAIISRIVDSQLQCGASLFRFRQSALDRWSELIGEVDQVVRTMPLWKLQTVGEERLDFLYENLDRGTRITLKPGVAYCFRAFYELIRDLIEGAWVRFVQQLNAKKLGNLTDLGTFLFGQERAILDAYRPIMLDLQHGICLYCRKPLRNQTQVDHFIPWSRYPADLGQNFVLAHSHCNSAKSDHVAAEQHLASWIERNQLHQVELQARLDAVALPSNLSATVQIAKWVYQQTERANGQVWIEEKVLKHLAPSWSRHFAA